MDKTLVVAALIIINKAKEATCPICIEATLLEKKYTLNQVRVFYSKTDPEKLTFLQNIKSNGILDYVKNIVLKADTMIKAAQEFGFRSPLDSPRYQDTITGHNKYKVCCHTNILKKWH